MLQLSETLFDRQILSLQTGTAVATSSMPIINPNNLKIEGFFCDDRFDKRRLIVLYQDVRDVIDQGIVVDSHEALTDPDELIRLKEILQLNFQLIGKPVETLAKDKVGKVGDFATEMTTMYVQKLYVSQSMLKSFTGGTLSVDRTQINEITSRHIIVNDLLKPMSANAVAAA